MASLLHASPLATLAAILTLGSPASADGRADWDAYAWQEIRLAECTATESGILACPPFREKWDWKRNQWIDIAITLDPASGAIALTQRLTNSDPRDDDHVCVTALALSAAGNTLVAHHQNWHVDAGEVVERTFAYTAPHLEQIVSIQIGSKQCRQGARQDDATYAGVLAGIQS
ncbi:hypothetical protein [Devosia limi]|uniref:Uncharacterized protein n=1 Tax=Devosia limi DSM 17137 TaxID=1121477 RepID=A0A1M4V2Q3_9HYPH|nr:hypothetical protein [Devosia limi]SHE63274.1 hypothetical protein SAMN02745223_00737 [Devosia limi DSM 17137]